jgi:hypothetical protein
MVYNGVAVGTLPHILVHPTFPFIFRFSGSGAFPFNVEWNRDKFCSNESMIFLSILGSNFSARDLFMIILDFFFGYHITI